MDNWERYAIAGGVVLASLVLARIVDARMRRANLAPQAATRYRVLRRSVVSGIVFVSVMSALLVIPQVRAIAGGILASSALVGLVVGFAAQRTLANFAAGIMIAFTQPVRLGDRIAVDDFEGVVEEIGLTYTYVRTDADVRVVIPNEKLASDTIRNATIVDRAQRAEITVSVPLQSDLEAVLETVRGAVSGERDCEAFVSSLEGNATVTVRALAPDPAAAERLEHDLRLRVHASLRAAGTFA